MPVLQTDKPSDCTLVELVMNEIRQRIAQRNLAPGQKIPSIRSLAEKLAVSRSTVVDAYDRLVAEGVIRSRPGSGFFVENTATPFALDELASKLDPVIDPIWLNRQNSLAHGSLLPGIGSLPGSWTAEKLVRQSLRMMARSSDGATLTDYGTPLGLLPLRQLLSARLTEQGIMVHPDQIILTDSGLHATDLVCRFLLEPGDVVLVDDPGYFNFLALLRAHRATVVGVPMTRTGPDVERLAELLAEHKPRLYITNPALHNPTGMVISPAVMHRVLKLAEHHDLLIIEDDILGDLETTPSPRYAAFDGLERVIRVSSFSKVISPAIRCGYIVLRADWVKNLADIQIATCLGASRSSSMAVYNILKSGGFHKHTEALRTRLAKAMTETITRLKAIGVQPWMEPNGGIFLWCSLPHGLDAAELTRRALDYGMVLAPGDAFSPGRTAKSQLRFNVSRCEDRRIFELLEILMNEQMRAAA